MRFLSLAVIVFVFFSCFNFVKETKWSDEQAIEIEDCVSLVSLTEIQTFFTQMNGPRHVSVRSNAEMLAYQDLMVNRLNDAGLEIELQPVTIDCVLSMESSIETEDYICVQYTMNNIIAVKKGSDTNLKPLLITGHWDSVPYSPGISDNAAACAAITEAARILKDKTFKHTIIFVIFGFEEEGMKGSYYYTEQMKFTPELVINMDVMGFTSPVNDNPPLTDILIGIPRTGNFLAGFATQFSAQIGVDFARIAERFSPGLIYYLLVMDDNMNSDPLLTDTIRSDHTPFWGKGIPALFLNDTANIRRNHPYHSDQDNMSNINYDFLINSIKAVIATIMVKAILE